ncbi:MAG: hypothetical protein KDE56_12090, partial [Anaerolineales bacterium]|nr:hypothetical protein [Anaerolineales bacterium]
MVGGKVDLHCLERLRPAGRGKVDPSGEFGGHAGLVGEARHGAHEGDPVRQVDMIDERTADGEYAGKPAG